MLSVNNLSMQHGHKLLYTDVNFTLNAGSRYGLVGANGVGKTTLLQLLAGEEVPSEGEVTFPKHARLGLLQQDHFRYEHDRVVDVVLQGNAELWGVYQAKHAIIENAESFDEQAGYRLAELEERIAQLDGYSAEARAREILVGLAIPPHQHDEPLSALSGGYRLRVLLAQVLFMKPEILLLDEPTNHLDIMTIEWLKSHLINDYRGVLIFISHDQGFLDDVCTHILDIDYGEIELYVGNFAQAMRLKQEVVEQKEHEIAYTQKKIDKMQRFVDRFRTKASKAKQAQSKLKQIERIELPDVKRSSRIAPNLAFSQKRPSGKRVLSIKDVSKSFGEKKVLTDVSFQVHRGEHVALIGHNGIGKSTLLKIIVDQLSRDTGEVTWGHETHVSYFAQNLEEILNVDQTALSWLRDNSGNCSDADVRKTLARVLFTKDEVDKNVHSLSGGESAKLLLAKIMLEQGNVLILDEPTNHMDLESISALAKALKQYPGTIIFVSHNRHFVSRLAKRVISLTETGIHDYLGTYKDYLAKVGNDYLSQEWLKQER